MTLDEKWRVLHRSRFSELPFNCGGPPAESSDPVLRDWSRKWTTPDQLRAERHIDRFDLRTKRILQIGIGNSGLARRFHDHVGQIVGTSLDEPELQLAQQLNYPNYRVVKHNKYSGLLDEISGRFDFIIDNNPTSACCCIRHFAELLHFLESTLANGGQIVTDRVGLAWIPEGGHSRWSFDFEDLQAVASVAGLEVWKVNKHTYVLCRGAPHRPALGSRFRSSIRRLGRLGLRAMRRS